MKNGTRFPLRALMISALLAGQISQAASEPLRPAGRVVDIDGPRLYTNRVKTTKSWYQAHTGMRTYLAERLRTDKDTRAILDFNIGGHAGIDRNTVIQIVSEGDVSKSGNSMRVDVGRMWAKLDRQEKPLEIRTSGGVIGIEGTELLIGVDAEKGVTEVLLFEGKVSVTDDKGNVKQMFPGDYAEFGGPKSMCVLSYPPASLRTLVVERFPTFSSFLATQNVTSIPNPASPTLVRGANKIRPDLLSVWTSSQQAKEATIEWLSPSQADAGDGPPQFRWSPVPGASSYAVYVTGEGSTEEIWLSGRTEESQFVVPEGAPSLEAGRYSWSVVPLDAEGAAMEQPAATWFTTSGWTASGVTLEALPGVPQE